MNKAWGCAWLLAAAILFPSVGRAQGTTIPLQVSLFHPLQVYPDVYSINDLRLDLIYGVNQNVDGIDLGLVNQANGDVQGFELGADNRVAGDFAGWQIGLFNEVKGNFNFLQLGILANISRGHVAGFQASVFYNDAGQEMRGLQVGLVNHTGSLYGVQIGLLNFNDDTKYLGFFPFVNAAF